MILFLDFLFFYIQQGKSLVLSILIEVLSFRELPLFFHFLTLQDLLIKWIALQVLILEYGLFFRDRDKRFYFLVV
jgi:hypothetical protein